MIYRSLSMVAGAVLRARAAFGHELLHERLVLAPAPGAPTSDARGGVWLHGASVGELNSARTLIGALSDLPLIVTANTVTGRDLARGWGVPARLAPLDVPGAVARFLDAWQPRVLVTVEGEIWPNRARMATAQGVAQMVVGARMSHRSARRWRQLRGLIVPVLQGLDALSAQDAASEARLLSLGLPERALMPRMNLKLLAPAAITPPPETPQRARTVLAASTHEGEDEPMLRAWLQARDRMPGLRLILAPRHPARSDAIATLLVGLGLDFSRESRGEPPAQLHLADTLGQMDRWYAAAGICVTGGSLVDRGGHTPWEPAAHRCAILHGPHVANSAEGYALLTQAGAAREIDAGTLGPALIRLARTPQQARDMGAAARRVLLAEAGDPASLIARIRSHALHALA